MIFPDPALVQTVPCTSALGADGTGAHRSEHGQPGVDGSDASA